MFTSRVVTKRDTSHFSWDRQHPQGSAPIPSLDPNNGIPSGVIKRLPQNHVARRWPPNTLVLLGDGLREVRHGRKIHLYVLVLVVVADIDGRTVLARHARAAASSSLVADPEVLRVVGPQILDALLDGAQVGVFVEGYIAAEDVVLGDKMLVSVLMSKYQSCGIRLVEGRALSTYEFAIDETARQAARAESQVGEE